MRGARRAEQLPAPGQLYPDVTAIMTGIDLETTPPCEILLGLPGDAVPCGKPSSARLKITMPCCGAVYIRFVCQSCLCDLGDPSHQWLCEEGCTVFSRACLDGDLIYQVFIKRRESRSTLAEGPFVFGTAEERRAFVMTPELGVYWYHYAEEDNWFSWSRGGAWKLRVPDIPADRPHVPPEITEDDRL